VIEFSLKPEAFVLKFSFT